MAKGSGIGELIGWGIAGVGVWWLGSANNWFGLFGTTTSTATTATSGTAPASPTVVLAGPVTPTINNALQADVSINGSVSNLAVIPGGDAYNTSGQDVTATLAALGVTPAQVYALMQAAYTIQPASTTTPPAATTTTPPATTTTPAPASPTNTRPSTIFGTGQISGASPSGRLPLMHGPAPIVRPVAGVSGLGMGGPMVFATRKNYVRRGSSYR